jgi:hypothetical protein
MNHRGKRGPSKREGPKKHAEHQGGTQVDSGLDADVASRRMLWRGCAGCPRPRATLRRLDGSYGHSGVVAVALWPPQFVPQSPCIHVPVVWLFAVMLVRPVANAGDL